METERSQAHPSSKVMKSSSGQGTKCHLSDSRQHGPWRLAPPVAFVEGGLHRASRRGDRAPGLEGVQDPWRSSCLGRLFGSGRDRGTMETRKQTK